MNSILKSLGKAWFRAVGYYPVCIGKEKFKVDPDHIGFWRGAAQGRWEPHTFAILSKFLGGGSVYCDVGAWIGPTVLYAARLCRRVVCFEPDPIAYRYLRWNIELNDLRNVDSFSFALSDRTALQRMSSRGGRLGESTTSALFDDSPNSRQIEVPALTWAAIRDLTRIERIDFLKIDIEGGEFALLPTLGGYLAKHKPVVYLSTHAPFLEAGLRERAMRQVADALAVYTTCLHNDMTPADPRDLTRGAALEHCRSYLFLD